MGRTIVVKLKIFLLGLFTISCAAKTESLLIPTSPSNDDKNEIISLQPKKNLGIKDQGILFLEERVKKLEKILSKKEGEIAILKQNRLQDPKETNENLKKTNDLIDKSINQEFEKEFRSNVKEPPFKLDDDEIEILKKNQLYRQALVFKELTKGTIKEPKKITTTPTVPKTNLFDLPLANEISPNLLFNSPIKKIKLKNIVSAKSNYKKAYKLYSKKNYPEAILAFNSYLKIYPQDNAADNAVFWTGLAYWQQNKIKKAKQYFALVIKNYDFISTENGGKTPDALLMLARLEQKQRPDYSKEYYQKIIELFPQTTAAKRANSSLKKLK